MSRQFRPVCVVHNTALESCCDPVAFVVRDFRRAAVCVVAAFGAVVADSVQRYTDTKTSLLGKSSATTDTVPAHCRAPHVEHHHIVPRIIDRRLIVSSDCRRHRDFFVCCRRVCIGIGAVLDDRKRDIFPACAHVRLVADGVHTAVLSAWHPTFAFRRKHTSPVCRASPFVFAVVLGPRAQAEVPQSGPVTSPARVFVIHKSQLCRTPCLNSSIFGCLFLCCLATDPIASRRNRGDFWTIYRLCVGGVRSIWALPTSCSCRQ